jgi:glycosyltransferase involved in cell wall biosynthesis
LPGEGNGSVSDEAWEGRDVRIGIDMLAVQAPGSRFRGIGRYCHHLVSALLALETEHQFLLYAHDGLPTDRLPSVAPASSRTLRREPHLGERTLFAAIDRLARTNPDGLDLLLLLSPFEMHGDFCPPARPLNGLKMAAVVYDLIPFLLQEVYLNDPHWAGKYYRHLLNLRHYHTLLAISEATRADCRYLTGLAADRVVNISGATDPDLFVPDETFPIPFAARRDLQRLGIGRPYLFSVASMDDRKNLWGLIDAFRLLPTRLRQTHQLVITCAISEADAARVRSYADGRGVGEALILTNAVPDPTLRVLYQRCAVFAFPSIYEGFGLPILEAMQCGAPVVAGNNSSQGEVLGDAGLLANAHDPADIAAKLTRVLSEETLGLDLRRRGLEQARRFSWERTATLTVEALTRSSVPPSRRSSPSRRGVRVRSDRSHSPKPRVAVFSPWPPKGSGISDYSVRLVRQLALRYAIDIYHDSGYIPDLGLNSHEFGCYDYRLFDRNSALFDYRGVVYQMGNSLYHRFVYDTLKRHPGIVTLHDFCLAGFQQWYGYQDGVEPGYLAREAEHFRPDRADEILPAIAEWLKTPAVLHDRCARRGWHLNRRVFDQAETVVVHSPWCLEQVRNLFPEHEPRTAVIPMGATSRSVSAEEKAAIRARFDLPGDALAIASFGILHPAKMNVETLEAFEPIARANPSMILLFVGHDAGLGEARRKAEELSIEGRVRFLGRQSPDSFADLIAVTDVGISLRRPPTNGETSASLLDLLRAGIPTIVSDVGTFADYPDTVVRKVKWEAVGIEGLSRAIRELAADASAREALGRAAWSHVADHHAWSRAAAMYEEVIERCYAKRVGGRATRAPVAPGPHRGASRVSALS